MIKIHESSVRGAMHANTLAQQTAAAQPLMRLIDKKALLSAIKPTPLMSIKTTILKMCVLLVLL
jgi:hypothetical protein